MACAALHEAITRLQLHLHAVVEFTPDVAGEDIIINLVLAVLDEAGFEDAEAVRAFDMLLIFTFGSVLWQIPRAETQRQRLLHLAILSGEDAPSLFAHATQLGQRDPAAYFAYGLEARLRSPAAGPGAAIGPQPKVT